MSSRRKLSEEQLLIEIRASAGPLAAGTAARLLTLASELGAYKVGRHTSVSVRFRLLNRSQRRWLTLFVISAVGTFYCGWLDQWRKEGAPTRTARDYLKNLEIVLGPNVVRHPSHFRDAIRLRQVQRHWTQVKQSIASAVSQLRRSVRELPSGTNPAYTSDIEGLATEIKSTQRGRSRRLRNEALARAKGICVVCRRDFKRVLEGRGICVLQVHHINQLSARDRPAVTRLEELAVVCANCHSLLHFVGPSHIALLPADLRARLQKDRTARF